MEVIKMPEETTEEKEAREAAEAKKAADEAVIKEAQEKAKAVAEKTPAKDKGEELAGKDVSKFSTSEMMDYIDKLKDENARRRITNRTLKDSQTKLEGKLGDLEAKLEDATGKLSTAEAEKKKSADAEKSEVERLKSEVNDFKTKLEEMEGKVKESDKTIFEKDLQINKQSRETEVNSLLLAAGVKFSSDYEKQGFMADLLKTDSDGDFTVNEEEVNYRVGQFIKKSKEDKPPAPETPPAGPGTRSVEPQLNERIKALTAKARESGLTEDDQKELTELLELAGQAAEWDPRQSGG
jgi:hypothetical protein